MKSSANFLSKNSIWRQSASSGGEPHGIAKPISKKENIEYWSTYPLSAQIRFLAYGPTSGQQIKSNNYLDELVAIINNLPQSSCIINQLQIIITNTKLFFLFFFKELYG